MMMIFGKNIITLKTSGFDESLLWQGMSGRSVLLANTGVCVCVCACVERRGWEGKEGEMTFVCEMQSHT